MDNFLELTIKDGFEICRLGNLKMFAAANTDRVAQEWAFELKSLYPQITFNAQDDYARIIATFRAIKNNREDLGSFAIFLQYFANHQRSVAENRTIAQQSTFTPEQIAENRKKIAEVFQSVLTKTQPKFTENINKNLKQMAGR